MEEGGEAGVRGPSALVYLERPGEAQRVFVREQTNPFTVGARGWIIMVLFYAINRFSFSFFFFFLAFPFTHFSFFLKHSLIFFYVSFVFACICVTLPPVCLCIYMCAFVCALIVGHSFLNLIFLVVALRAYVFFWFFGFFLCLFGLLCLFLFLHNAIYICTVFYFFSYFFLFEISFSVLIFIHAFMRGFFFFLMHVCFLIFFHFVILCICLVRGGGARAATHTGLVFIYIGGGSDCVDGDGWTDGRTDARATPGGGGDDGNRLFLWL